jgi:hemerythrin superfamily protein
VNDVDVLQLLQQDHREIDELLRRLEVPAGRADFDRSGREFLLDRLVSVASRHEAAEELVLWPEVRSRLPDGASLADEALRQEREGKAVLDLLRVVRSEDEIVEECGLLHELVQKHGDFEEHRVFPSLRKRTTCVWRTLAAYRFRAARRAGPTRPHPNGPDRPLGLVTMGASVAVVDHLRDLGSRQRRHPTGFESPGSDDAVLVLTRHHGRIIALLAEIEGHEDPDDMIVREVIRELSIHDSVERQHLYPVVRQRLDDGNRQYGHLLSEHERVTQLAADLDVYRFHDEARTNWIRELTLTVRTHIEQEEGGVLPALAARMTAEELIDLGVRLDSAWAKAPTRPHRHAVAVGTGARISSLVAGPLDKARDSLWRRRQSTRSHGGV